MDCSTWNFCFNSTLIFSKRGFTLLNFLINVGQFTLPVLFVRHGWFAILLIALGSILCAHTALLMAESLVQLLGFVEVTDVQHLFHTFHIRIVHRYVPRFTWNWDGNMGWKPKRVVTESLRKRKVRLLGYGYVSMGFCWGFPFCKSPGDHFFHVLCIFEGWCDVEFQHQTIQSWH